MTASIISPVGRHPGFFQRIVFVITIRAILRKAGISRTEVTGRIPDLTVSSADTPRLLVLYFHKPDDEMSETTFLQLKRYIENGGGILAVHSPTASFKPFPRFADLIGGRFVGHESITSITLKRSDGNLVHSEGEAGSFTINDEPYIHEIRSPLVTELTTEIMNRTIPFAWTRIIRSGKIAYFAGGHTVSTLLNRQVRMFFYRAIQWLLSHN